MRKARPLTDTAICVFKLFVGNMILRVAAQQTPTVKTLTTAYQHVWGYFKKICTPIEKAKYLKLLQQLDPMNDLLGPFLKQLAVKYQIEYLVNSRIIREL